MKTLTLNNAKKLLKQCDLCILVDNSFGDKEYEWYLGDYVEGVRNRLCIATGYHSGNGSDSIAFHHFEDCNFKNEYARQLYDCYKTVKAESNT